MRGSWLWWIACLGCGRLAFDPVARGQDAGGEDADGRDATLACDPCALEPAPVDDAFAGGDGPLGGAWIATPSAFRINSGTLEVYGYGTALRADLMGGAEQWAQVTIAGLTENQFGVVLRAQGLDTGADRLTAMYHHTPPSSHVHVGWYRGGMEMAITTSDADLPVGTRFRAVARGNTVAIYADETLIVETSAPGWPHGNAGGYLGLLATAIPPGILIDDFGAGACGCR